MERHLYDVRHSTGKFVEKDTAYETPRKCADDNLFLNI